MPGTCSWYPDGLPFTLPDSPNLGDLTRQLVQFDDARVVAKTKRSTELVAKDGVVYYTINASTHPDTFDDLAAGGRTFVAVPAPPANTKYRDVRLTGHGVRAYVYPAIAEAPATTATVELRKGGYSTFVPLDRTAQPTTYANVWRGPSPLLAPHALNSDWMFGTVMQFTSARCLQQ